VRTCSSCSRARRGHARGKTIPDGRKRFKRRELMAEIFDGPPEFVDLNVVEEFTA
jgi:hypothetical protein